MTIQEIKEKYNNYYTKGWITEAERQTLTWQAIQKLDKAQMRLVDYALSLFA